MFSKRRQMSDTGRRAQKGEGGMYAESACLRHRQERHR